MTVRPSDTGEALVNPEMGWTFHFYSNIPRNYGSRLEPSDTLEDFPGLSVVYLRLPWSLLEPAEGQFNWAILDAPAQRWIDKGKRIALRITCSENWMQYATPKWVRDAGAKGVDYEWGKGPKPGGPCWDPDFLDPLFLTKLDDFLAAMAKRYDGNPHVAFVDVGSFGMWGEGHTGGSSRLNEEQTEAAVKRHIDLHLKHFRHTLLAVVDDVVGPEKPGRHFPVTDYARARGLTLRDDSILVQPPPRSWFHAEMAQEFWPAVPVILEHEHYGASKQRKAWSGDLLLNAIEDYHASYMSIHWWPREELADNRSAIERINRRLGYRLRLVSASWPEEVALNEPFTVQTEWANAGVAPCYPGGFWALTLKDKSGGVVSVNVNEAFDVRQLRPAPPGAAPTAISKAQIVIGRLQPDAFGSFGPVIQPGIFDVFISVGAHDGTPVIALPLPDGDDHRRYRLGKIRVTPAP